MLLVAPVSAPGASTRIAKLAVALSDSGRFEFWGWVRGDETVPAASPAWTYRVLLSGGGYSSRFTKAYYIAWIWQVFWNLLWRRRTLVYCYGLEASFAASLAAIFRGHQIIFDDPDRTSMLMADGAPKKLMELVEEFTAGASFLHLVPGASRYKRARSNMFVIPNTPSQADLDAALRSRLAQRVDDRLTLYVNGWLGESRGMAMLGAVATHYRDDPRLRIISAGRATGNDAAAFIAMSNVEHLGELPQHEALALYRQADLACTFYDPAIQINRYAEPNKWWDCVFMGTPPVLNEGIVTAKSLIEDDACFVVQYDRTGGSLFALLDSLLNDRSPVARKREALASLKMSAKTHDQHFAELSSAIFGESSIGHG
jgi:hypothetical protein